MKKMTKFEQIAMVLKTKQNVIVKDEDGDYMVISNFKDFDGDFASSSWWTSVADAKKDIGTSGGCDKEDYKDSWEIVDAFDFEAPVFEKGKRVQILPNAKKEYEKAGFGWWEEMDEMVGGVFEIRYVGQLACDVFNKDKQNYFSFPNSCLSHPFKEEKKETIKIGDNVYDKKEFEEATKDLKVIK